MGTRIGIAAGLFLLAALAACNAIWPRKMWGILKSWRFKNPQNVEPSNLVVGYYIVTGVVGALVFAGAGIYVVGFAETAAERAERQERKAAQCERTMDELEDLWATTVDDPGREQAAIQAVKERARELGLTAERHDKHTGEFLWLTIYDGEQRLGIVPVPPSSAERNCSPGDF